MPEFLYPDHVGRPAVVDTKAERVRARTILARLTKAIPNWGPTLDFTNPLELLVATILAAQARDERINELTKSLFKTYRTAADYVKAPQAVLETAIRASGFFRQKAKSIKTCCKSLIENHGGEVPRTMEELTALRGVGRKTASIVLGGAFGVPSIAVDRHVARVASRLGFTASDDGDQIESDLAGVFAEKDWVRATWCLVLHGRQVCRPTPECPVCPVRDLCPYPLKTV